MPSSSTHVGALFFCTWELRRRRHLTQKQHLWHRCCFQSLFSDGIVDAFRWCFQMGCRCLLPDGAMDALIDQGVLPPRASRRRSMFRGIWVHRKSHNFRTHFPESLNRPIRNNRQETEQGTISRCKPLTLNRHRTKARREEEEDAGRSRSRDRKARKKK